MILRKDNSHIFISKATIYKKNLLHLNNENITLAANDAQFVVPHAHSTGKMTVPEFLKEFKEIVEEEVGRSHSCIARIQHDTVTPALELKLQSQELEKLTVSNLSTEAADIKYLADLKQSIVTNQQVIRDHEEYIRLIKQRAAVLQKELKHLYTTHLVPDDKKNEPIIKDPARAGLMSNNQHIFFRKPSRGVLAPNSIENPVLSPFRPQN